MSLNSTFESKMLAFAKDITQSNPKHSQEGQNPELREYMDYQRKLNHERLVYHSLDHAKTELQGKIESAKGESDKLEGYLQQAFPFSHEFADADTLMLMLRKMINSHNAPEDWYRMNSYYYALTFDCMKRFIVIYNQLVRESPEKAHGYQASEEVEIDFDDWSELYFPDLDFHIGKELNTTHYPFAKRNKAIAKELDKKIESGESREEALLALKESYEIDEVSINVLLNKPISEKDLELFYTSVDNPIYDYLNQKKEGSWEALDGDSLMDQAYSMGSHLKVWVWGKQSQR